MCLIQFNFHRFDDPKIMDLFLHFHTIHVPSYNFLYFSTYLFYVQLICTTYYWKPFWIHFEFICLDTIYFVENWKHCNKIIFKCVNSAVRPIFNIFKYVNSVATVRKQCCLLQSKFMWFYCLCAKKKKKTLNADA